MLNFRIFVKSSSSIISLFSKQNVVSLSKDLPLPKHQEEQVTKYEGEITESELLKSLINEINEK